MLGKRGQFWDILIPLVITVIIIFLVLILFTDLGEWFGSAGTFLKNWLRFGR